MARGADRLALLLRRAVNVLEAGTASSTAIQAVAFYRALASLALVGAFLEVDVCTLALRDAIRLAAVGPGPHLPHVHRALVDFPHGTMAPSVAQLIAGLRREGHAFLHRADQAVIVRPMEEIYVPGLELQQQLQQQQQQQQQQQHGEDSSSCSNFVGTVIATSLMAPRVAWTAVPQKAREAVVEPPRRGEAVGGDRRPKEAAVVPFEMHFFPSVPLELDPAARPKHPLAPAVQRLSHEFCAAWVAGAPIALSCGARGTLDWCSVTRHSVATTEEFGRMLVILRSFVSDAAAGGACSAASRASSPPSCGPAQQKVLLLHATIDERLSYNRHTSVVAIGCIAPSPGAATNLFIVDALALRNLMPLLVEFTMCPGVLKALTEHDVAAQLQRDFALYVAPALPLHMFMVPNRVFHYAPEFNLLKRPLDAQLVAALWCFLHSALAVLVGVLTQPTSAARHMVATRVAAFSGKYAEKLAVWRPPSMWHGVTFNGDFRGVSKLLHEWRQRRAFADDLAVEVVLPAFVIARLARRVAALVAVSRAEVPDAANSAGQLVRGELLGAVDRAERAAAAAHARPPTGHRLCLRRRYVSSITSLIEEFVAEARQRGGGASPSTSRTAELGAAARALHRRSRFTEGIGFGVFVPFCVVPNGAGAFVRVSVCEATARGNPRHPRAREVAACVPAAAEAYACRRKNNQLAAALEARLLGKAQSAPGGASSLPRQPLWGGGLVASAADLRSLVAAMAASPYVAVDLEFHTHHSYNGYAALLQCSFLGEDASAGGNAGVQWDAVVDCIALRWDLHVLNSVFCDSKIIKIFHGSKNDVGYLMRDFGVYVVNLFDTQIAACFLDALVACEQDLRGGNRGAMMEAASACQRGPVQPLLSSLLSSVRREVKLQVGLGALLQRLIGVRKTSQVSVFHDWRERPLTPQALQYARGDTRFLFAIFAKICNDIARVGNRISASISEFPADGDGGGDRGGGGETTGSNNVAAEALELLASKMAHASLSLYTHVDRLVRLDKETRVLWDSVHSSRTPRRSTIAHWCSALPQGAASLLNAHQRYEVVYAAQLSLQRYAASWRDLVARREDLDLGCVLSSADLATVVADALQPNSTPREMRPGLVASLGRFVDDAEAELRVLCGNLRSLAPVVVQAHAAAHPAVATAATSPFIQRIAAQLIAASSSPSSLVLVSARKISLAGARDAPPRPRRAAVRVLTAQCRACGSGRVAVDEASIAAALIMPRWDASIPDDVGSSDGAAGALLRILADDTTVKVTLSGYELLHGLEEAGHRVGLEEAAAPLQSLLDLAELVDLHEWACAGQVGGGRGGSEIGIEGGAPRQLPPTRSSASSQMARRPVWGPLRRRPSTHATVLALRKRLGLSRARVKELLRPSSEHSAASHTNSANESPGRDEEEIRAHSPRAACSQHRELRLLAALHELFSVPQERTGAGAAEAHNDASGRRICDAVVATRKLVEYFTDGVQGKAAAVEARVAESRALRRLAAHLADEYGVPPDLVLPESTRCHLRQLQQTARSLDALERCLADSGAYLALRHVDEVASALWG